jgi:hypothetical protein
MLLSGCALIERPAESPSAPLRAPAAAPATAAQSPADELVTYLGRLRGMNENALHAEAARQRQAAQRDHSDITRLKAAMALALAAQSDDADLLALVDPVVRKGAAADPDVRAMASFLQGIGHERRRLKESAAAAGARLRDAQRARENEKQRADVLQERAAQLQQKLDALTDLEKSLSDRQGAAR